MLKMYFLKIMMLTFLVIKKNKERKQNFALYLEYYCIQSQICCNEFIRKKRSPKRMRSGKRLRYSILVFIFINEHKACLRQFYW